MIYDIFYVSKQQVDADSWQQFRQRFPSAQKIDNIQSIDDVKKKSFTKFFWLVWDDQEILEDFNFDYRVEKWDEQYIHTFKTQYKNIDYYRAGVCLFPKNSTVSQKEFDFRFFINKKEILTIASKFKFTTYKKYYIDSYKDYLEICKQETQPLFWCIRDDIEIIDNSIFDLHFDPLDSKYDYDRSINHVFKNSEFYDGLMLTSNTNTLTEKEFKYRFPIEKKECNILVSTPKPFEIFYIDTYEQYTEALRSSKTDMFWVIRSDIIVEDNFKFTDYYIPVYDQFHRNITHIFKNGEWYDGVALYSKHTPITKKEFDHRFPIEKKVHDVVASVPKPFDIVFISYKEESAEENFKNLKEKFPRAIRINGVKGIHNAHIEAAKISSTDMFWVVDADAVITKKFNFEIDYVPHYNKGERDALYDTVHVWKSLNPVNGLVYGYGGVKLLPRKLILSMDTGTTDMTTSISKNFKVMPTVSNITAFNTDEFSTWRSAFRECVKLSSRVIDRSYDDETEERLMAWCSQGKSRPFGNYSIAGARLGKQYGEENINDKEKLLLINNFDWLKEQFIKWQIVNE